jgi:outer membrane lipoprotein carrier protein
MEEERRGTEQRKSACLLLRLVAGKMPALPRGLALALLVILVGVAGAAPAALSGLEERYRKAGTLQATFMERYSENGVQVKVESGTAYFLRPGKMRWEYEQPEKSLFLVDGKYVWFYAPADHTATRMPAKKSEDWRTPIAFLTTGMKLSRICSSVEAIGDEKASEITQKGTMYRAPTDRSPADRSPGDQVYRCVLRGADSEPEGKAQRVLFEVTPQNELARIVIPQEGGMQIEFLFKNWVWNPVLAKSLFAFEPSPSTVIVDGVLPEAPGMRQ